MDNNGEEFTLPRSYSWINKKFFQDILIKEHKMLNLVVKSVHISLGTGAGDNYEGVLYKARVRTEEDCNETDYYFFIKCLPEYSFQRNMVSKMQTSVKEVNFYTIALPTINRFLKQNSSSLDVAHLFPKCYHAFADGTNDVIVMEDLGNCAFKMANRKAGLDINHCRLIVRGLAQFHAACFAMKIKEPEAVTTIAHIFKDTMYVEECRNTLSPIVTTTVQTMSESAKQIPGCEHLSDSIRSFEKDVFDKLAEVVRPKEPCAVLCLSDCWVNNLMFKCNFGDNIQELPLAVKFLDFQLSRYASPALDLIFFFFTSTTGEFRKKHLNHLLECYHRTFINILIDFQVDPSLFTYEMLEKEWKDHLLYGLVIGGKVLGVVVADADDVPERKEMTEDDFKALLSNSIPSMFENDLYKERFGSVLKECEEHGLFS